MFNKTYLNLYNMIFVRRNNLQTFQVSLRNRIMHKTFGAIIPSKKSVHHICKKKKKRIPATMYTYEIIVIKVIRQ